MYFKRIEIIGFKSFANRTVLEFPNGVTSIVGPNGCGKSNISDAIKWVLGEQSAKSLRGLRMEDVIFNGTTNQEPVNYAQVTVVFSNDDRALPIEYDEVEVSRRLYRNGDSDYLLNKNVVRLKDIQSLLAGTGLGVGNYSVIEQGQIDRILNAKPEDRRTLFEEAAGITRYKSKKKEALRNLEATEQNLQRVVDILSELKRQIASLERQAKKAEKYKRDYEYLKKYDISLARNQINDINSKQNTVSAQLNQSKEKKDECVSYLEETQNKLQVSREENQAAEAEFSDVKAQCQIIENQIESNSEKIGIYTGYIKDAEVSFEEIDRLLLNASENLQNIQSKYDEAKIVYDEICSEKDSGEFSLNEVRSNHSNLISEIESLQSLVEENALLVSQSKRDFENKMHELLKFQNHFAALIHKEADCRASFDAVEGELKTSQVQFNFYREEAQKVGLFLEEKKTERESLKVKISNLQASAQEAHLKHQQLSSQLSVDESQLDFVQNLVNTYAGFEESNKYLLNKRKEDEFLSEAILGSLSDLVDVEPGYELALETALGHLAQSIVCRDKSSVSYITSLLSQSDYDKAVLLCLDQVVSVESGSSDDKLINFVKPRDEVKALVNALLANVDVVSSIDEISSVDADVVKVTKNGDLLKGPLVVTGTNKQKDAKSLLFSRKNKIEELQASILASNQKREELATEEIGYLQELEACRTHIDLLDGEIDQLQREYVEKDAKCNHFNSHVEKFLSEVERIRDRWLGLDVEKGDCLDRLFGLQSERLSLQSEIVLLEKGVAESTEKIKSQKNELDQSLVRLTKAESQFDMLVDRFEQAKSFYEQTNRALETERRLIESKREEKKLLEDRIKESQDELIRLDETIAAKRLEKESLESQHHELIAKREVTLQTLQEVELRKDEVQQELNNLQSNLHELELESQKLNHSLERLYERIGDQYQYDLKNEDEESKVVWDEEELPDSEKMDVLREKLAKVGPVNLIAVEEYDDLRERYEFLNREQEDLLKAKDDLHKALLKINRTTREMFIETFTQIQTYFVEYFKLLFNGGTAEIVLLDEGDILESGIEIVAKPPGKKLQNLSLLSGGEKALTAIALMFSVFKVKPSPFCVLDEIDAPLDDTNVQRFVNVLQEFVKESQFIIITHNKRTMSVADVLYGVTMQQSGVSKVVSVKFDEETTLNQLETNRRLFSKEAVA